MVSLHVFSPVGALDGEHSDMQNVGPELRVLEARDSAHATCNSRELTRKGINVLQCELAGIN